MQLCSEPLPLDPKVGLDAETTRINISLPGVELTDYTNKSIPVVQMMTSCRNVKLTSPELPWKRGTCREELLQNLVKTGHNLQTCIANDGKNGVCI